MRAPHCSPSGECVCSHVATIFPTEVAAALKVIMGRDGGNSREKKNTGKTFSPDDLRIFGRQALTSTEVATKFEYSGEGNESMEAPDLDSRECASAALDQQVWAEYGRTNYATHSSGYNQ